MAAVYWRAQHDGAELPEGGLDQYNGVDAAIRAERTRQRQERLRVENERYRARLREVERREDLAAPFRVSVPQQPTEQEQPTPEPEEIAYPRLTII
jgi:hypothetical protein